MPADTESARLKALAQHALRAGRGADALRLMAGAVAAAPGDARLRLEHGCLLAHLGRHGEAIAALRASLALRGDQAEGWYFLGRSLAHAGFGDEALPALRQARALGHPKAAEALAEAEFAVGFPADALPLCADLARERPDDIGRRLRWGECLSRVGEHATARALYEQATRERPGEPAYWLALAQAEEDGGRREAAAAAYDRALVLHPRWPFALAARLAMDRDRADAAHIADAQELLADPTLPDEDRASLGFALGRVLDARGEAPAAMARWHEANAARRRGSGGYDLAEMTGRVERCLALFDTGLFRRRTERCSTDARPLFIVGMPRSGTTLTEQILAAHPQVHGAGEIPDLALVARHVCARGGAVARWPHVPEFLQEDALPAAAARYLEGAARHAPAGVVRIVDKSPMNYTLLGLAALLFPKSRVVWCRRDPRDVAVSIYSENFAPAERFATRLDGIGHLINLQARFMAHWQAVLPVPILPLDYEALVADPEPQVRRLLEFAGLPWDPACLAFHANERGVQTPSRWQVRQPLHARSVGRWRRHAGALGPLLSVLDPRPRD